MDAIPPDDRGLLLGDGLFETVLFKQGRAVLWDAHMTRLATGCAILGLPAPDGAALLAEAEAAAATLDRAAVRVTWTAGSGGRGLPRPQPLQPRAIVTAAPSPAVTTPVTLATVAVRRNAGSPTGRLKTLAYLDNVLARREAAANGADDAVMLDTGGHVACSSAANLFWIEGGRLFTPSLAGAVLPGVMRAQVLALEPVHEVQTASLAGAEAAFVTSSLIGVRPVSALDGRDLAPHPLIGSLRERLAPSS